MNLVRVRQHRTSRTAVLATTRPPTISSNHPHKPNMKVAILLCLLGVALAAPQRPLDSDEIESVEPYNFGFVVEDDENTVYANRQETQNDDGIVQGEYSWVAANGIRYITTYTADAENGFNAVTREEQTGIEVKLPEPYDSDESK